MKQPFRFFRHALTMVSRCVRSYTMLSVTIVLSFSLLLGYLGFVDTEIYNEYKNIFRIDRGTMRVNAGLHAPARFDLLMQKLALREDTTFYTVYYRMQSLSDGSLVSEDGQKLPNKQMQVCFLVGNVWEFFFHLGEKVPITWIDGKEHDGVNLNQGEAIMDRQTFYALGLHQMEEPRYRYHPRREDGIELDVKIVGLIEQDGSFYLDREDVLDYNPEYTSWMLLPLKGITEQQITGPGTLCYTILHTQSPEEIYALTQQMGFELPLTHSIYRWQDQCLEDIQTRKGTKALITCAMLLILGINLYSSFSNALNERKFEIGVKRAIGASSFQIVRQFLYESLTVMLVNILISVALVVDIGLVYKLVMEHTLGQEHYHYRTFTLCLSPHSIGMFLACSMTLTLAFSLIFAYKSTQVQVIDYLKAE